MTKDKSHSRDSFQTMVFRVSAVAIGGLSTVLLARFLTPSSMGAYSIALQLFGIVGVLFGGAWTGIAFLISRSGLSVRVVMANSFVLIAGVAPLLVGTAAFFPVDPDFGITLAVRLAVCLGVISYLVQQYFLGAFLGQSETLSFNLGQVVQQVIFVPLVLMVFTLRHASLAEVLVVWSSSHCLNTARIMLQHRSLWVLPRRNLLSRSLLQTLLRFDFQVGLSGLASLLSFRGSLFIVTYFAGLENAAFLGVALSLAELVYHLPASLVVSFYGRIGATSMPEAAKLTALLIRVSIWLSCLFVLAGEALAGLIPMVFGHKYDAAILPFRILLLGTAVFGSKDIYSTFFTNQLGQPGMATKVYWVALPVGLIAGVLLISQFGLVGAAVGNVLVYVFVFSCMLAMFVKGTRLSLSQSVVLTPADIRMTLQAVRNALRL